MIYIDRDSITMPELFASKMMDRYHQSVIERLLEPDMFVQSRFRISEDFAKMVDPHVRELFHHKCSYCESPELSYDSCTGLFRPRSSVAELKDRRNDGYYWLGYVWFNLYAVCPECDRNKGNHFPVEGDHLLPPPVETYMDQKALRAYVRNEQPLLLDPCDSEVRDKVQFWYERDGKVVGRTKKAQLTIEILKLNRSSLRLMRSERWAFIENLLAEATIPKAPKNAFERIWNQLEPGMPFLGLTRQAVLQWYLDNNARIKSEAPRWFGKLSALFPDIKAPIGSEMYLKINKPIVEFRLTETPANMVSGFMNRLEWVEIENFKSIEHARLDVAKATHSEGENCILLIGENGVGKSSVLQAVALVLSGQEHLDALGFLDPTRLIRKGAKDAFASIRAKFNDNDLPVEVKITPNGILTSQSSLVKPVVGIGSVRRLPEDGEVISFEDDRTKIKGLFRHDVVFPDVEPWLGDSSQVDQVRFDEAAKTILEMLMVSEERIGKDRLLARDSGKVVIDVGNGPESIQEMCDGHRSVIGYALYVLRCFAEHWSSPFNAEGVVLIDEIGNHLHPSWKIKVLSLLRSIFPQTTFIISTHDPLCLRGAREGEVWVMHRDTGGNRVQVVQKDVPPGTSLETLLTGEWFFMDHTTDAYTTRLFQEYNSQMFSESPDMERMRNIEDELQNNLLQRSTGSAKFDTFFNIIRQVKSEEPSAIRNDEDLKQKFADRIRQQLKG